MLLRLLIVWNWTRVTLALWNAAQWKPTWQSSNHTHGKSYTAVDGKKNNGDTPGICAHTQSTALAWWMVDLQGLYSIQKVVITNRKNYTYQRLRNFRIEFFENDPRSIPNSPGKVCVTRGNSAIGPGDSIFTCEKGIVGRFARLIWQPGYKQFLVICEFQVLVDDVFSREIRYSKFIGERATSTAILTKTTNAFWKCVLECSQRRDKQRCTAFNWAPERGQCHLMSIDPYGSVNKIADSTWMFLRVTTN